MYAYLVIKSLLSQALSGGAGRAGPLSKLLGEAVKTSSDVYGLGILLYERGYGAGGNFVTYCRHGRLSYKVTTGTVEVRYEAPQIVRIRPSSSRIAESRPALNKSNH